MSPVRFAFDIGAPWIYRVLRSVCPVVKIGHYVLLTQYDEIQEVLARPDDFPVPYGEKAAHLGWDPNFLLGMGDVRSAEYVELLEAVRSLWDPADSERVAGIATATIDAALQDDGGSIDVMQCIIVPSALAVVEDYYGVTLQEGERKALFEANLKVSQFLFGRPRPSTRKIRDAGAAAKTVFETIDRTLSDADTARRSSAAGSGATIVERARDGRVRLRNGQLRSSLMGMINGFVPAYTNAAGRALHVVLSDRKARALMVAAARAGDRNRVLQLCYEALRFRYIIPIAWRRTHAKQEIARETGRPIQIAANRYVLMPLLSAMQDVRRVLLPRRFAANRSSDVYLIYGYAYHTCVGRWIADTLLATICVALFGRESAPVRRTRWDGMMVSELVVEYGPLHLRPAEPR
jgi:cytochrome P450